MTLKPSTEDNGGEKKMDEGASRKRSASEAEAEAGGEGEGTAQPKKEEEEGKPSVDPCEDLSMIFNEWSFAEGRKAEVFEVPEVEGDALKGLLELRNHLKHGDERSELVLKDYFILGEESGVAAGHAFSIALGQVGPQDETLAVMGKLYVDGQHNIPADKVEEDGCVGLLRIPVGAVGVWWLQEPEIFLTYKAPDDPEGDIAIILRHSHPKYHERDFMHEEQKLFTQLRIVNRIFFDFVELNPAATLEQEKERAKKAKEEDVKEEDDELQVLEEEEAQSLDEMLREESYSLDQLINDKDLHDFMKFQLSQKTVSADGKEETGSLSELVAYPLIQDLIYADEDETGRRGPKRRKGQGRSKVRTVAKTPGYGSNYVPLSGEHFVTPVVEDSFAFHYPSLLGEKRYEELKKEDRVAQHRVAFEEHGKAEADKAEVGRGVEVEKEVRYSSVRLPFPDGYSLDLRPGHFVAVKSRSAHAQLQGDLYVVKCAYMVRRTQEWGKAEGLKIHGPLFRIRGKELLGKKGREELEARGIMSGEQDDELVYMGQCGDAGVEEVVGQIDVAVETHLRPGQTLKQWQEKGGEANAPRPDLAGKFLCRLKYSGQMRWEELSGEELESLGASSEEERLAGLCLPCAQREEEKERLAPKFADDGSWARIGGEKYLKGDFVLFDPYADAAPKPSMKDEVGPADYPEPYEENQMKLSQYKKNLKKWPEMSKFTGKPLPAAPEPFTVHRIESFDVKAKRIDLRAFYRTSDVDHGSLRENRLHRLSREVYWSFEVNSVSSKKGWQAFEGRAWVSAFQTDKEADAWTAAGPDRLFCRSVIEIGGGKEASVEFSELGSEREEGLKEAAERAPEWPKAPRTLEAMELFCGGGGMARGMKDAGIQTRFANDMCRPAIATFQRNFPYAVTHLQDINVMLKDAQEHVHCPRAQAVDLDCPLNEACLLATRKDADGEPLSRDKQRSAMKMCAKVPRRGELDLICGGPPCQGFSKMNRFPKSGNSQRKNTGMTAMLACVDLLRPRWLLIENVANLAQHNSIIRAPLHDMGYQVQIYITNAMAYGVPESRRRNFILCAGPGCVLPKAPVPLFSSLYTPLHFPVMGEKDDNRLNGQHPALLYQMTSFEALGDLVAAPAENQETGKGMKGIAGDEEAEGALQIPPGPTTWWQRQIRTRHGLTFNNSTKKLTALETARVRQVPFPTAEIPHPNWRFIANETVNITQDGKSFTFEPLLPYYEDKSNVWYWRCDNCIAREKAGKKMMGKECNIQGDDRRLNRKIVPSCLAHMGKKNSWTNCYGRVSYDAQFMTITCADGLTNKTGRLLHPELQRMYTARELARGQGFPDGHVFAGLHYRVLVTQVGNAVPPPMAKQIGRTITAAAAHSPDPRLADLKAKPDEDEMPELL